MTRPQATDLNAVRENNLSLVLNLIRQQGAISRADIVRQTHLSATTVSALANLLLESGFVHETGMGESSGGRPPILLEFNYQYRYVIGVDMGATHLTVVLMDLQGEVAAQRYVRYAVMQDPAGTAAAIQTLIHEIIQETALALSNILGLGLAVPAPLEGDELNHLSTLILPLWDGYDVVGVLHEALQMPIYLENDANAGVIAEKWWGRGREFTNLAYIKLGTGVGSGLIVKNEVYRGDGGTAGEIGHTTINSDGPLCRCGNRGCLESFVGAPALIEEVNQQQTNGYTPVNSITDIIAAAQQHDTLSCHTVTKAGSFLGIAIANLINLFNPGLIVLGGELAAAGDILLDAVQHSVSQRAMPKAASEAIITVSQLGDNAVAIGAATLVIHHAFQPSNLTTMLKTN